MKKKNTFRYAAAGVAVLIAVMASGCGKSTEPDPKETSAPKAEIYPEANGGFTETEDMDTGAGKKETEETASPDFQEALEAATELYEEEEDTLTPTQRNSINMLNYMSALTQKVNDSKGNELLLETTYSSLVNDIYPNAVDSKTEAQITSLMDTIEQYRMITVKKERLEYIYEQNRAQALRQAVPNPVGLLSAVQSGSVLKAAASVLYMAVDSVSSYQAATSQADLQYLQDGWELEDKEAEELHKSTKNALTYMLNMVRDYDFDGDYALSEEAIRDFVRWSEKPETQLISKIEWFISHEDTYRGFGPYWLELVKDYYDSGDYRGCLEAIGNYEKVSTRIYRKDINKAKVLPMVILSAKEVLDDAEYVKTASGYCEEIRDNTKDADWALKYFAAQIYLDLYAVSDNDAFLENAYDIAFDNVNNLADEQRSLNLAYLSDIQEAEAEKDASSKKKKEVKAYNKLLKEERKTALPPINEALYLNADLLFALSENLDIPEEKKDRIEAILHECGGNIFLADPLDNLFWFEDQKHKIQADGIEASYGGDTFTIPASIVSARTVLKVTVSGETETRLEDWVVGRVERPKNAESCSEFLATYESKAGDGYDYREGDMVTVEVIPVAEAPEEAIIFRFRAVEKKKYMVLSKTGFERVTE